MQWTEPAGKLLVVREPARRRLSHLIGTTLSGMATDPIEDATVRAFIVPAKRDRYATLLGNATRRATFLDGLNHCHDFDTRYATALPSTADIPALLRSHGAGATCRVISDYREIDGQVMPIEDAVREAEGSGMGSLLCCVPGKLAYYVGESGEQRLLLRRNAK
jgi:hypothetical protein